jgi:hypothetical protein
MLFSRERRTCVVKLGNMCFAVIYREVVSSVLSALFCFHEY